MRPAAGMERSPEAYRNYVNDELEYGAAWQPGTPLELGAVGEYSKARFVPKSDLCNFEISFEPYPDPSPASYRFFPTCSSPSHSAELSRGS